MAVNSYRTEALQRHRAARRAAEAPPTMTEAQRAAEAAEVAAEAAGLDAQTAGETWAMREWIGATLPAPAVDDEVIRWTDEDGGEHVHAITGRLDVWTHDRNGGKRVHLTVKPDRVAVLRMKSSGERRGGRNGEAFWTPGVLPVEAFTVEAKHRPRLNAAGRRMVKALRSVTTAAAVEAAQRHRQYGGSADRTPVVMGGERSGAVKAQRTLAEVEAVERIAAKAAAGLDGAVKVEAVEAAAAAAGSVLAAAGSVLDMTPAQRQTARRKAATAARRARQAVVSKRTGSTA